MRLGADGLVHEWDPAEPVEDPSDLAFDRLIRACVSRAIMDYLAVWFPLQARKYILLWKSPQRSDLEGSAAMTFKRFVIQQRRILCEYFGAEGIGRKLAHEFGLEAMLLRAEQAIRDRDPQAVRLLSQRGFVQSIAQTFVRGTKRPRRKAWTTTMAS